MVGFDTHADAGIYKLSDDLGLIQTVDYFTPVVDDPFHYGEIAAANSLSDVYAMGGQPLTALNIIGFSDTVLSYEVLGEILQGGIATLKRANVALIGGHSVKAPELFYGLSVTGTVSPRQAISNRGVRIGDLFVLTKPLGIGILTTALKKENLSDDLLKQAVDVMRTLNAGAAQAMQAVGVRAATDVTGFGFSGHLYQMVDGENLTVEIYADQLPYFPEAVDLANAGNVAGGLKKNAAYVAAEFAVDPTVNPEIIPILHDPQTSGGLLIAVSEAKLDRLLEALADNGVGTRAVVGRAVEREDTSLIVRHS